MFWINFMHMSIGAGLTISTAMLCGLVALSKFCDIMVAMVECIPMEETR